MDRTQILDLYEWEPGTCFRHPSMGEALTAHVKTVHPRRGGAEDVRACQPCILDMEQEREAVARAEDLDYEPGHVGEPLT
ncbi:hypothetical protein ACWERY_01765 [Streptomyces sp. NPDC004082]